MRSAVCNPKNHVRFTPESGHVQRTRSCLLWANSGHSRRVRPFIEKRYRRDVEHARARALYRFRSGLLAGPAIQNNNPDQGCDHQRATESRCQSPVIYCRDLHVCRLGGAANAICEVGHKATTNFADPRKGSGIDMSLRGARPCLPIRFTPECGLRCKSECPLWAKSVTLPMAGYM